MGAQYNSTAPTLPDKARTPLQTDASGNLKTVSGATGSSADQIQGNVAAGVADSGNPVKVGAKVLTTAPVGNLTNGHRADLSVDAYNALRVMPAEALAGQDAIANNGLAAIRMTGNWGPLQIAGNVFNGTTWDRQRGDTTGTHVVAKPFTSGGLSSFRVVTGTTGVIKASAGQLYCLVAVRNANAAVRYLHLYDKATAPTLSTDTPILTIPLLASSILSNIDLTTIGSAFANGIAWAYTTDNVAIPTTAGTSTELMFSGGYK